MTENQSNLLKAIGEFLVVILSAVVPLWGRRIKNRIAKKKKEVFDKSHSNQWSREVFELAVELRMKTNADRSWIMLRSNGTAYYNGLKGDHLTMVYESLEKGITGVIQDTQKIPVHFYEDTVELADRYGFVKIVTDNLIDGSYFKAKIESHGTRSFYMVPLRQNTNSLPEGYIGISYLDNVSTIDEQDLADLLKDYSGIVGLLLRVQK